MFSVNSEDSIYAETNKKLNNTENEKYIFSS